MQGIGGVIFGQFPNPFIPNRPPYPLSAHPEPAAPSVHPEQR